MEYCIDVNFKLQQYLPFTVLKLAFNHGKVIHVKLVATVLTVYGMRWESEILEERSYEVCIFLVVD